MIRYFLYARKSTDEEDRQVLSIEAQLHELREFARKESLTIAKEFVESRTARTPGRPIFNDMLTRIQQGKAAGILAWHPDRLARNSVDGGQLIYLLDEEKIHALKFPTFWFENTPQGKFMLNIAFGQSKYYVDNLRENVLRGIRQKLRRGEYPGKPPVGYLNEPRLHTIVPDPQKAPLIKKLFEIFAVGDTSLAELHRLAASWGLRTYLGNPIARSRIPEILAEPFYIGFFRYDGETYEGSHPPIISKDLFDRVQEVLKARARSQAKTKTIPRFPLLGLLRCEECGCSITAECQKGHTYYRCTKQSVKCSQPYVREEELARQLRDILLDVALPDEWRENMLNQLDAWAKEEAEEGQTKRRKLEEELSAVTTRLDSLLDAHLDGVITREEYTGRKEKFLAEKFELTQKIASLEQDGALWLEPAKRTAGESFRANSVARNGSLAEVKAFFRNVDSNLTLSARRPRCAWKNFWSILPDFERSEGWLWR